MLLNTQRLLPALLLSFITGMAYAQRPDNLEPVPEPPPSPRGVQSGEAIPLGEPQITIFRRGENLIKEYRLNGHLYAIKITPDGSAPYYLIDMDGDGHMEKQILDNDNAQVVVPMWVLYRW